MQTSERTDASISAKIPADLYDKLVAAAEKGRRSIAAQIELILERGLKKRKEKRMKQ